MFWKDLYECNNNVNETQQNFFTKMKEDNQKTPKEYGKFVYEILFAKYRIRNRQFLWFFVVFFE